MLIEERILHDPNHLSLQSARQKSSFFSPGSSLRFTFSWQIKIKPVLVFQVSPKLSDAVFWPSNICSGLRIKVSPWMKKYFAQSLKTGCMKCSAMLSFPIFGKLTHGFKSYVLQLWNHALYANFCCHILSTCPLTEKFLKTAVRFVVRLAFSKKLKVAVWFFWTAQDTNTWPSISFGDCHDHMPSNKRLPLYPAIEELRPLAYS